MNLIHHGNAGKKMNLANISKPKHTFWKGKKVLVTGHNGFKGSWLSLWLLQMKANVSGISLVPEYSNNLFDALKIENDINNIICDIRNKEAVKKYIQEINPDIIFHLAAQPLVVTSYKDPVGTWETNVMGTINILDAIRALKNNCIGVFITTDKVYKNNEWIYGYRENDELGGYDPYSSSKAASEIAISSWRSSFDIQDSNKISNFTISSARAGNVIGGGDWSENRIIPDVINSLQNNQKIQIRNPNSTRPWQHVLEPLSGYLLLAEKLNEDKNLFSTPFNFGPFIESNRTVKELVDECLKHWDGEYIFDDILDKPHEAGVLNLSIEKAIKYLNWSPKWDFSKSVSATINWYKNVHEGQTTALDYSLKNLEEYLKN